MGKVYIVVGSHHYGESNTTSLWSLVANTYTKAYEELCASILEAVREWYSGSDKSQEEIDEIENEILRDPEWGFYRWEAGGDVFTWTIDEHDF